MIDVRTQRIEAIKAIRQFGLDTFGVTPGLMVSKTFVEAFGAEIDRNEKINLDATLNTMKPEYLAEYLREKGWDCYKPYNG